MPHWGISDKILQYMFFCEQKEDIGITLVNYFVIIVLFLAPFKSILRSCANQLILVFWLLSSDNGYIIDK